MIRIEWNHQERFILSCHFVMQEFFHHHSLVFLCLQLCVPKQALLLTFQVSNFYHHNNNDSAEPLQILSSDNGINNENVNTEADNDTSNSGIGNNLVGHVKNNDFLISSPQLHLPSSLLNSSSTKKERMLTLLRHVFDWCCKRQ